MRNHAGDHRGTRHQDRPQPAARRLDRRVERRRAVARRVLGERHEQDRVRHRDADRHDRAHERLHVQRRAGHEQHQHDAADTAGTVDTTTSASRSDWKFAASSRKITTTASSRPGPRGPEASRRSARIWPRTSTRRRRAAASPARAIAWSMSVDDRPERLAVNVRREADHPLHVVRGRPRPASCRCRPSRRRRAADGPVAIGRPRHDRQVARRPRVDVIFACGIFDLDLKAIPARRVAPVVRVDEPARRGRGDERPADLVGGRRRTARRARGRSRPAASGSRAAGRTAGRAARRSSPARAGPSRRTRGWRRESGPDGDLDRRRRAEAHDLADDVGRLERERHVRAAPASTRRRRSLLAAPPSTGGALGFSDTPSTASCGPLVNEIDRVDRVARRLDADVARRDLDVARARRLLDHVQRLAARSARSARTACRSARGAGAGTACVSTAGKISVPRRGSTTSDESATVTTQIAADNEPPCGRGRPSSRSR